MPEATVPPHVAYALVRDELILGGNSRQNLATFCTTWTEPEVGWEKFARYFDVRRPPAAVARLTTALGQAVRPTNATDIFTLGFGMHRRVSGVWLRGDVVVVRRSGPAEAGAHIG
jgi:hypothetical protein